MNDDTYFIQNLSTNITRLRKKRGIKQEELAQAIGIGKNAISNIEKKRAFPTLANLDKMARFFKATPTQLFGSPQEIELERAVYQTDEYSERTQQILTQLQAIQQVLENHDFARQLEQMAALPTPETKIDSDGTTLYWKLDEKGLPIKTKFYREEQIPDLSGDFSQALEETPLEKLLKAQNL
jgi:transcriptional regulator with XRE-family HTH domain